MSAEGPTSVSTPAASNSLGSLVRGLYRLMLLVAVLGIFAHAARLVNIGVLWDDGYIFQRYAHHLAQGQGLAWQPGGPPVYGLTSLLYVFPALAGRAITDDPSSAAMVPCFVFGALFVVALARLLWRHVPGRRPARATGLLLAMTCVAVSSTPAHFASGMDTTFGMTYQALHLMAAARFAAVPSRRRAMILGGLGGLALWIRPEVMAFSAFLPAAMVLRPPAKGTRRHAAEALAVTIGVLAACVGLNVAYFGLPLPLPFYAKTFSLYEGGIRRAYQGVSLQHLLTFLGFYWPLFVVVLAELFGRPRRFLRRADGMVLGTLAALSAVLLYHGAFAMPVMAMAERFLQVAVVPLAYLASRTISDVWPEDEVSLGAEPLRWLVALAGLVATGLLLWPTAGKELKEANWYLSRTRPQWDVVEHAASDGPRSYWYKVDEFVPLPSDVSIATTEVGMIGILHPNKKVIDLAGLNEPRFAFAPLDPQVLLGEMKPDLLYMPHQDYGPMVEAIENHPIFRAEYIYLSKRQARTRTFGVAFRRDSPHFEAMQAIVDGRRGKDPKARRR